MRLRYVLALAGLFVLLNLVIVLTLTCACSPVPQPASGDAQSTIYDKLLTRDSVRSRR